MTQRILILASTVPPDHSGAGKRSIRLAEALSKRGHEVFLVTDTRSPCLVAPEVDILRLNGLHWGTTFRPRSLRRSVIRGFGSLLRTGMLASAATRNGRFSVALQVGAYFHTQLLGAACSAIGIPVVGQPTMEGGDDPITISEGRLGNLRGRLFRSHPAVIPISPRLYSSVVASGYPAHRTFMVPNAPDTDQFRVPSSTEREQVRRHLGIDPHEKVIVTVGKLEPRKGQKELLTAAQILAAKGNRLHVLFVGPAGDDTISNGYAAHLSRLALNSPEGLRTRFVGATKSPEKYLAAADVFALLSKAEGLGTAVLEALCCGLPVVMKRLPGISDYIQDVVGAKCFWEVSDTGVTGALTESLALSESLDRALIRESALREFDPASVYGQYDDILTWVANKWRHPNPNGRVLP